MSKWLLIHIYRERNVKTKLNLLRFFDLVDCYVLSHSIDVSTILSWTLPELYAKKRVTCNYEFPLGIFVLASFIEV
jgi:hypothetical protein